LSSTAKVNSNETETQRTREGKKGRRAKKMKKKTPKCGGFEEYEEGESVACSSEENSAIKKKRKVNSAGKASRREPEPPTR
jgi:hypothetical protein